MREAGGLTRWNSDTVMNTVTGVITAGAAATPVTDATVTATQAVAGSITVTSTPVDFDLATYTMRLPAAAPVLAPYSAAALTFAPQSAVAGKYALKASAPGRSTLQKNVDVGTGAATADFAY